MLEIKIDGFQGPLDLLLQLIEKEELDITALSLAQVTDQYWEHVRSLPGLDPDALSQFIVIGAKLLYLKSCALLPHPDQGRGREAIAPEEDVAAQLTQMLGEYKRFKEAADLFRQLEERGRRAYSRLGPPKGYPLPPGLKGVTLEELLRVVQEALARRPSEPQEGLLELEPITVDAKVAEITSALAEGGGRLPFRSLLEACQTRTDIVVLFLAVLELVKAGHLWAEQESPFGEILLVSVNG